MRQALIAAAVAPLPAARGGGGDLARHAELRDPPSADPKLRVSLCVTDPPGGANPSILGALHGLSPEGQAAAIEARAQGGAGAAALRADLVPPGRSDAATDRRRRAVRLVVAVDPPDFGPADRIEDQSLTIDLPQPGPARLLGWSGPSDEAVTIDLGAITATETSELRAGLNAARTGGMADLAGAPSPAVTPSVAVSLGRSRHEPTG